MDLLNFLAQTFGAEGAEDELKKLRAGTRTTPAPELNAEGYDPNAPINVMGSSTRQPDPRPAPRNPSYTDPAERPEVTPRYVMTDNRMPPTKEEMKEIIPRNQGYFGSKGTLRNILGTLSDAFLVQAGGKAEYEALRDKERKGDAMYGFTDNPQAAMERMAMRGYTDDAEKLQSNFATQEYNKGNLASQTASRESLSADRRTDNKAAGLKQLGRLANAGAPMSVMRTAARNSGISEEEMAELGINENMTPEARAYLGSLDEGVASQRRFPLEERRVETGEKNATTGRISATRPRAAPNPRSTTRDERIQAAFDTPPAQRTEYQRNLVKAAENDAAPKRGSGRREVTPTGTPAFRIVNQRSN